ncbi:hypothetical protein [Terasakiella pusilla]|uniref:hypothetical protein n=1 Tax=Terasakiella pusilla TaxID=64973 RepID=UPI003AA8DBBB
MTEIVISPDLKDAAQTEFGALDQQRDLMQARGGAGLALSRVYGYVQGGTDEVVAHALQSDLAVRRVYQNLLRRQALFHIPQAIAASSEEYPMRHCAGCRVRLQASRAQEDQVYLIIELADQRSDSPTRLNLFGAGEVFASVDLPAQRNGVIQTLLDKDSSQARLLADPKTEIILR